MTTEDYVSFETATLLKEKGFNDIPVHTYYLSYGGFYLSPMDVTNKDLYAQGHIAAPTLQMAMKWLREREWFICIIPLAFYCGGKAVKFGCTIWAGDNLEIDDVDTHAFDTYKDACEAAIKYCLKNLIKEE